MKGLPKLDALMFLPEQEETGVSKLSEAEREALFRWGMRMFGLGQHVVARIDKIKHDGHAVILDDDTRWEVDPTDSVVAEAWAVGDRVVVIDDEMYKLDDSERLGVQPDYD